MSSAMSYVIAENIRHRKQELDSSCAAASLAMIFDSPEALFRKEVKTRSDGTKITDIVSFLKRNSIPHFFVKFPEKINYDSYINDLVNVSFQFPILISGIFSNKVKGPGRPSVQHHACVLSDGLFYDPSGMNPVDSKAFRSVANYKILFSSMIIFDSERPHFIKNHSNYFSNAVNA
jgi:hypothetical protein